MNLYFDPFKCLGSVPPKHLCGSVTAKVLPDQNIRLSIPIGRNDYPDEFAVFNVSQEQADELIQTLLTANTQT